MVFGGLHSGSETGSSDLWYGQYGRPGQRHEVCLYGVDTDGDGLIGCDDPDCWGYCTPSCPPGTGPDCGFPRCGDGACAAELETCRLCPEDCGVCNVCGDFFCDPGETATSCPGDCSDHSR